MAAKKSVRKGRKTTGQSTEIAKIPQPHGGALNSGGTPGNVGGGRLPSAVTQLAAARLPKHVGTLDQIADGTVIVQLTEKCKKCGYEPESGVTKLPMECKPGERVRAIEALAKLADQKELVITHAGAEAFFECIHAAIVEIAGDAVARQVEARTMAMMEDTVHKGRL